MLKLSKEKVNLIIFVVVLIVLLILGIFIFQRIYKKNLVDGPGQNNNQATMTPIVLQNENSKVVESTTLPTDIDLAYALPEFSPTTKIISVIDNTRTDGRTITAKYEINRDMGTVRKLVVDHLKANKWEVDENKGTVVEATLGKSKSTIFIDSLDNEKSFLTVSLNINY